MSDEKDKPELPIPSALAAGAKAVKPFSSSLLAGTSIAPGALVTPTQLAEMMFDAFINHGFFIEAHGQENVLVISSSELDALGVIKSETAEKAMEVLVAAIANQLHDDPDFEQVGYFVSKDLKSFELIFGDDPSAINLQNTLDARQDEVRAAILFEGRVQELHADGREHGHG